MEDEQLVAVERAELSGDALSLREHVRVAWCYLSRCPFAEARHRFSDAPAAVCGSQAEGGAPS